MVIHDPAGVTKTIALDGPPLVTDARLAVVRLAADGGATRVFFAGGTSLTVGARVFHAGNAVTGEVTAVDGARSVIRVRTASSVGSCPGRVAGFGNALGRTAHTIQGARRDGDDLVLTTQDDVGAGFMHITGVSGARLDTRMRLPFAASYVGASVLDAQFRLIGRVRAADQDHLELAEAPADGSALVGRDVWISSVGPGDRMELPALVSWQR